MSRTHLLGAVSAAALACLTTGAFAQESTTAITGGGSTLAEFDYFNEFATFNASQPASGAMFANPAPATGQQVLYWPSGSGSGQAAFLNDDLSCDANKVTGANNKLCSGTVGGAASVSYGASDATLNTTQTAQWASSSVGPSAAGALIQLPSKGVGVAFPIVNANFTANGQVALNDSDLCGIFSGKIADWSQTSAGSKLAPGAITVIYRSDGSGTSFLLLNHLAAVCTASNSNFSLPIVPSTTFLNAFPGGVAPNGNFVGQSGSQAVASYESSLLGTTVSSAIAYLSPDFTTVDPNSNATLSNGQPSQLNVPSVLNGKTAYLPNVANITLALNSAKVGMHLKPPTTQAGFQDPSSFVPLIQLASKGYPVIGYTTFDLAQCYASTTVANGIINFLKNDHYDSNGAYATSIANNGFVSIGRSGAKTFITVIKAGILSNSKKFNTNIENPTTCKGLVGR